MTSPEAASLSGESRRVETRDHQWPAALLRSEARTGQFVDPPAWAGVVEAARLHQVASLLYWRVKNASGEPAPPAVTAVLRDAFFEGAAGALRRERELGAILDVLSKAGILATPFKGAALAYTVYPDPACRPMADLDLWIDDAEMDRAVASLEAIGYRATRRDDRPLALQRANHGEVNLSCRRPGCGVVELHWGVFAGQWLRRTAAIDHDGVAARRIQGEIAGHRVRFLAPEDAIVHLCVHAAINHQLSIPLRGLVDIALVGARGVDAPTVVDRARAWRVATVAGTVLGLAARIFGEEALSPNLVEAALALRPSGWRRRAIDRFVSPARFLDGARLSSGRRRLPYLVAMVDRPADALRLVGRAVWPEPDWLIARYGRSGPRARLAHLASALAGRF